jgi:hypothetical protein
MLPMQGQHVQTIALVARQAALKWKVVKNQHKLRPISHLQATKYINQIPLRSYTVP